MLVGITLAISSPGSIAAVNRIAAAREERMRIEKLSAVAKASPPCKSSPSRSNFMNRSVHLREHPKPGNSASGIALVDWALRRFSMAILLFPCLSGAAQTSPDGFLIKHGRRLFPIGCYELPKESAGLRAMADAGFNLVHCGNAADLDRAQAAGMMGWVSVPLQLGADNDTLRKAVAAVSDHPALAVWEGPDEVVWNFTAYSGLYRSGVYKKPSEWWDQTPFAVERSEEEAKKSLPQLRAGCQWVRRLDRRRHRIWVNEAAESDLKFVREYLDEIDITGCDIYPIHEKNRLPASVGDYTGRYQSVGRGKPVWMVLQGFSWHEIKPPKDEHLVYPSFVESRLMAYAAIAHGAKGILYWGTEMVPKESSFRESLFALTSELHALQPFLTAKEQTNVRVALTESKGRPLEGSRGVRWAARRAGRDWLIVLVNEDAHPHMGVELSGLGKLNGRSLELLYGSETATVKQAGFVTRMKPHEVKVFATNRKWETSRRNGRDFE
jgi:hypothetical protein